MATSLFEKRNFQVLCKFNDYIISLTHKEAKMKKRIAILAILVLSFFAFAFSSHIAVRADGFDDVDLEEVVIESQ